MSKEDSHIVPKTYLAQFTNANGRLLKIKKNIIKFPKTSNELHPSAVSYKDNFYRFENPLFIQRHQINDPSFIEKNSFKFYENKLGKILDKIIKRQPFLNEDDAFTLIFAFLSMKQRNKVVRKGITKDRINTYFDEQISEYNQDSRFAQEVSEAFNLSNVEIIETIEKMRSQWAEDSNTSKDLHNSYLLDSHSKDDSFLVNLASYLMQFPWFIFESKSNDVIITSDNPGFCIDNEKLHNTKFDGTFEFIYPLNSNNFLMISNRFKDNQPLKDLKKLHCRFINSTVVHKLNRCTFALADEEVYACSRLPLYSTWIDYKQFISNTL
jgi:Protein of unknown function (DUF4238)